MVRSGWRALALAAVTAVALLLTGGTAAAAGCQVEQAFTLHPGWNAVFFEVTPAADSLEAVFGGLPVLSVWKWSGGAPVQFVQDPGEEMLSQKGWHAWFPLSSGRQPFLTNLHRLQANRAYLVEVGGEREVTLRVEGRPSLRREAWAADSFNLTGFTVDPAAPPTFASFLASSPAHAGQAVYRLGPDGSWVRVADPAAAAMTRGEAFWVWCEGPSDFAGPLGVELDYGDGLDYDQGLTERQLKVRNLSGETRTLSLGVSGGSLPLRRQILSASGLSEWQALESTAALSLEPGQERPLRLSPAGEAVSPEAVLEIKDGAGSVVRVPMTVDAPPVGAVAAPQGLWVGTVTVNAVTQAQIPAVPEFNEPQPTGSEFMFRLILHVDAEGRARLLKEVIQMWDPGEEGVSGHLVLVTDDGLIPSFECPSALGVEPSCRRLSSAAYDFQGRELSLDGTAMEALQGTIELAHDFATNPFRHRYHPDHDDLDGLGYPLAEGLEESYDITREIAFEFSDDPLPGFDDPEWGVRVTGGAYRETMTGLHRNQIRVAGSFVLRKLADVAELNR